MRRLFFSLAFSLTLFATLLGPVSIARAAVVPPVKADCSVEVSAAFTSWLATVPNGATIGLAANGCYWMEGSILIQNRTGLTIEGNGARIVSKAPGPVGSLGYSVRRHVWCSNSTNVTIRNLRVEGSNLGPSDTGKAGFGSYSPKYEFEHAFAFDKCSNVLLEDASASAIWGDGVYIGGGVAVPASGVSIRRVVIDRNGRQGVGISSARGVLIDDVDILHSRRSGIDLEPNFTAATIDAVEIRNSFLNTHLLPFPSGGMGQVSNVWIHHNTIDGLAAPVVLVQPSDATRRRGWRVEYNTHLRTVGSTKAPLSFTNTDDVSVVGNVFKVSTKRIDHAVTFKGAGGVLAILNNDFRPACRTHSADAATGPVLTVGNLLGAC